MLTLLVVEFAQAAAIRERFGAQMANEVICRFAQRMRGCSRRGDHVDLYDGGAVLIAEFVATPFAARRLADRVHEALAAPLEIGHVKICADARIGIVSASGSELDAEQLLQRARQAARVALRGGRYHLAESTH